MDLTILVHFSQIFESEISVVELTFSGRNDVYSLVLFGQ